MNPQRGIFRTRAITRDHIGGGNLRVPPQAGADGTPARTRGFTFPRTVTTASVLLLPQDYDRKFLFIQNNDTLGVVWLSFGVAAAVGQGMRLAAGGGGILLDIGVPTSDIYAIGTIASNPNITITTA